MVASRNAVATYSPDIPGLVTAHPSDPQFGRGGEDRSLSNSTICFLERRNWNPTSDLLKKSGVAGSIRALRKYFL
jgi:hypothetical protein